MTEATSTTRNRRPGRRKGGNLCTCCRQEVPEELQRIEAQDGSGNYSDACSGCYEAELERLHKGDAAKEAAAAAVAGDDQVDEDIEDEDDEDLADEDLDGEDDDQGEGEGEGNTEEKAGEGDAGAGGGAP